jgi:uncharacterized membrane protein YecN with MAPEG domain
VSAAAVAALSLVALAALITALSLQVSRLRLKHRVSWGDGGHRDLLVAMRAHGNTLEQTALYGLLALAYAALPGARVDLVAGLATAFVLARLVHAGGVFGRRLIWRQGAHGVTVLVQAALAVAIVHRAGPWV